MIALIATYFVIAYLLIPRAVFQGFSSLILPLKNFQRTKSEEVSFAVLTAFAPFFLALFITWYSGWGQRFPWPGDSSIQQRRADYKLVFDIALDSTQLKSSEPKFWPATTRVVRRQGRFLFWFYLAVIGEALIFAGFVSQYGRWKNFAPYRVIADFLLRSVSQWHILLHPFTSPPKPKVEVWADILTKQDKLYSGIVADYPLDVDGKLMGILLDEPKRFDRETFVEKIKAAGKLSSEEKETIKAAHWRPIPSANLYLPYDEIHNINVRHEPKQLDSGASELLEQEDVPLELEEIGEAEQEQSSASDSGNPQI